MGQLLIFTEKVISLKQLKKNTNLFLKHANQITVYLLGSNGDTNSTDLVLNTLCAAEFL